MLSDNFNPANHMLPANNNWKKSNPYLLGQFMNE